MQVDLNASTRADGDRSAKNAVRTAKTTFSDIVVVCAKCAKRQGLAKREVGRALKKALRREHPDRKVKIVATGCLGPCPKRLLAAATPASLRERRVLLLDPGLSRDAVRQLIPDREP